MAAHRSGLYSCLDRGASYLYSPGGLPGGGDRFEWMKCGPPVMFPAKSGNQLSHLSESSAQLGVKGVDL
jgi:hypothetical protein